MDELTELKEFISRMKIQASRTQLRTDPDAVVATEKQASPNAHEVGDAIFDYLKGMEGKPLTESMWAPKSLRQPRQLAKISAKDTEMTSERLLLTKPVGTKLDINQTFERTSFKAADPTSQPFMVDAFTQTEDVTSESIQTDLRDIEDENSVTSPSTPSAAPSKAVIHADTTPEQPNVSLESLKNWANKQKALIVEAAQSNNGNLKAGQSAPIGRSSSAIAKPAEEPEDRRFMQYFSTWGTQEKRDRPRKLPPPLPFSLQLEAIQHTDPFQAAEVRTVTIKPLPPSATLAFVANLVYGGPLERIRMHLGGKGASVTFLSPADCKKFFDSTANGLAYNTSTPTGPERRVRYLDVELSDTVEPVVGKLYEYVQKGLTRCVKAVPVDDEITMPFLQKMAADKNRSVVKMQEGRGIAKVCYITVPSIRASFWTQFAEYNGTGSLHHLPLW